ncbi:MAG: PaaI family thioesterase [Prevotella sp.]|jgi:uncharacterized protein (TIGR00369 family)|nr:PaaI family thioesterase [Prevotella sp.]MCI1282533.1 PaaI family thioesterase [Prevotella sp.]
MRKIKNPWIGKEGYDCYACSPDNPIGLHMEFFEDGDDIISFWRPSEHYQGWLGTMHGGILSTLIDETCGWVITRKVQTTGMTVRLDVHYKHPVKTDEAQLTIKAHITESHRNFVTMKATIENNNAEVCVEADVVYYAMDAEKAKEMGFTHCDVEDEQLFSM